VLTTLVMGLGVRPVLWPGLLGLLRRPDMNSLVALGTLTAYGVSAAVVVISCTSPSLQPGLSHLPLSGRGSVDFTGSKFFGGYWEHSTRAVAGAGLLGLYFEAAAVTMAAVLLGRWLEARCLARAAAALKDLDDRIPTTALRLTATGEEETVRIGDIQPGDRLLIRPGDLIPADGRVFLGQGEVDESLLTGESVPILKRRGEEVVGGSLNGSGHFQLRVTAPASRSAVARLAEAVRQAQMGRPRLQRLADAVSAWFVPGVLLLATLTGLVWLMVGAGLTVALPYAVAVLVVACPCALGLATPAAIMAATSRAAQEGILFRDADALERLARCQMLVLDKTGTVTEGKPQVVQVWSVNREWPAERWLALAAGAESPSEHVWARAVVAAARERKIAIPSPDEGEFRAAAGRGVRARIEGNIIWVGEPAWVAEQAAFDLPPSPAEDHQTVVAVARTGGLLGWIALEDRERPDALLTLEHLRRLGFKVKLLTGDREGPARAVAQRLGVSYVAGARNKEQAIRRWQDGGVKVAMVGDGLNDAAALAQADCGLAMHSGTGLAHHAAHVLILGQRLEPLPKALSLARRTLNIIHQNLGWALGYNLVGIPLAAGAFQPLWGVSLHPAYAGLFMALSSVAVTLNSLRLLRRS
jgi:Cu+-exporting ATPase